MDGEIRELVHRVVGRVLSERGREATPVLGSAPRPRRAGVHVDVQPCSGPARPGDAGNDGAGARGPALVTARELSGAEAGTEVHIPARAIVTPLALEEAWRRDLRLAAGPAGAPTTERRPARTVAVGADHGGFALKGDVLAWIRELGFVAVDLGTHDANPVDYPDVARRVAEAVASGQCALGVLIDGAGIGSGMAANKVPGVRAATCWDEASARNAREHNHANVLSIGGRMLPVHVACAAVRAFLSTPEGGDRHARRVAKIHEIERAYSRRP